MTLGPIDRADDRPPYRQIADHLRAAIESGELQPGDRLPSEAALMAHYHVARFTEVVTARMPTAAERRRLDLPQGTPVIVLVRTAFDVAGRPVEVCDTVGSAPAYVLETVRDTLTEWLG